LAYDRGVRAVLLLVLGGCSFERGMLTNDAGPDGSIGETRDAPCFCGNSLREKTITIADDVAGTHASFPLWLSLTDADLAARASEDGVDIHFVAGTTKLDYQIQSWTKGTGRLDAWVRVPSLAAGMQIAMRYGDPEAAHAPTSAGVFISYRAVWHLDDSLTDDTIVDARGLAHGTASQLAASASVAGKLGRGIDFDGGSSQITFTNPLSGNTAHTISLWIDQRTTNTNDALVVLGNGMMNQARWFHSRFNTATIAVGFYTNDYTNPGEDIIGDGWVLLHWVFEGQNRMTRIYRDGALVAGPFQHNPGINTQGNGGYLGNAPGLFGSNMGLSGTLDEVRITDVARSADWIAAEAVNQGTPSAFYTIGSEQVPP
jgi:trimeric autotransporter adhesin